MENSIKKYLLKKYIEENNKVPSRNILNLLYQNFIKENPESLEIGIFPGSKSSLPQGGEESSSGSFEELKEKILLDLEEFENKIEEEKYLFYRYFNTFTNSFNKSISKIKNLERNVNKNLLIHSKNDPFVYSVVEDFTDYSKVDFDNSNIYFFNGKATLGFKKVASDSFNQSEIKYSFNHQDNMGAGYKAYNDISNVLKEDGKYFKVVAYSTSKTETVNFVINIDFDEPKEIDTIKYLTQNVNKNSKIVQTCFWSPNGNNFYEIFESKLVIQNNSNYVEIKQEKVKSIKLVLTKEVSDYTDAGKYVYLFTLDFIGYTENSYKINTDSTMYLGPYEILDENDEPVNFSLATVKGGTCCIIPDETSIDMFVSKDNSSWIKADFKGTSQQVIQFSESEENAETYNIFNILDESSESNWVAENYPEELSLKKNERCLNVYVPKENKALINFNSLNIQRNILKEDKVKLYKAYSGWEYKEGYYHTNIICNSIEGMYIDFGNRSCFLNGQQTNGKTFISFGKHSFKTSKENWLHIKDEPNINSLKSLKEKDKLYPFNHKYLIEGFDYKIDFRGNKKYKKKLDIFSFDLKLLSNSKFAYENELDVFTLKEVDENIYIIVKCKEISGEEKIEDYNITYRKNDTINSNKLYIKAILRSANEKVTPKIDQIQVRVI